MRYSSDNTYDYTPAELVCLNNAYERCFSQWGVSADDTQAQASIDDAIHNSFVDGITTGQLTDNAARRLGLSQS